MQIGIGVFMAYKKMYELRGQLPMISEIPRWNFAYYSGRPHFKRIWGFGPSYILSAC